MIIRHLPQVHELLTVLEQPATELSTLRALLTSEGKFPSHRTWERRLKALSDTLPAQISCLCCSPIKRIQSWVFSGRVVTIESTALRIQGGVRRQKHREQWELLRTSFVREGDFPKLVRHAFVYSWKLHVVWYLPIAAVLTPANIADSEPPPALLWEVPANVRSVLRDHYYNTPDLRETCEQGDRLLVTTKLGRHLYTNDGVAVRRLFHKLHFIAFEHDLELCVGLRSFLKAAC